MQAAASSHHSISWPKTCLRCNLVRFNSYSLGSEPAYQQTYTQHVEVSPWMRFLHRNRATAHLPHSQCISFLITLMGLLKPKRTTTTRATSDDRIDTGDSQKQRPHSSISGVWQLGRRSWSLVGNRECISVS